MPRESKKAKTARAAEAFDLLTEEYPEAHCELDFVDAFQLGVATILSAQTTDVRVNMVTPELFRRYPGAEALANAAQEDVEQVVKSTGFFRNKSKNIIGFARGLMADHDGAVPKTMAELSALPGVGRKTANVILGNADRGIQLYPDAQGTRISHNLIVGNGVGVLFGGDHGDASSNTVVRANIIAFSRRRHDVEAHWPSGNPVGSGNLVVGNCVHGGERGATRGRTAG